MGFFEFFLKKTTTFLSFSNEHLVKYYIGSYTTNVTKLLIKTIYIFKITKNDEHLKQNGTF